MKTKDIADEILDRWYGPIGKCWCKQKKRFIKPDECTKCCPECVALGPHENRKFRYIPQGDYK